MKTAFDRLILICLVSFGLSAHSWASSECYGETNDGKSISIRLSTLDPKGVPLEGEVVIESGGHHFGYRFSKEDIIQYFEYDDFDAMSATLGLKAFAETESPVSLKYVGPNFMDMDLKTIFKQGRVNEIKGNFMRLWKGPGYDSQNQYQMTRIACSAWNG